MLRTFPLVFFEYYYCTLIINYNFMYSSIKVCKLKCLLIIFLTQWSLFTNVYGQGKTEKIDNLLSTYAAYEQFNGTVLVAEKGKVIYKKGFGLANMEWDIPNQPDTKHRLGSVTKQFTAMLIMKLVEAGKLELHVPISTYLPKYPKQAADKITIHHLLEHSSGIPNFTSFREFYAKNSRNHFSPEKFVKVFADSTLDFNPGEKFKYSNSGYFLLGYIIEKVSGKTYEQMLRENIFVPLKMKNTGYDHHHTILEKRASGYEKHGFSYVNASYIDMSIPYAAGAMYATVEDLFLWDRALHDNKLISEKLKELIFKPHISTGKRSYGYGWSVGYEKIEGTDKSVNVIEHGGAIDGFHTFITRIPENEHFIVLLNNTGKTYLPEINKAIRQILYDADYEKPKKSLAKSLAEVITNKGISEGERFYEKNKNNKTYRLLENEINALGYNFLSERKIKEAIAVFKVNVDAFPESANVYDSLGEGYYNNQQYHLSLKNYKKAVALGGTNGLAQSMIEKIELILPKNN